MPPEFFNSREDALLVWAVAILAFAVYKDPRGITTSLLNVLRSLFTWKLQLLFGSAIAYCSVVVYAAEQTGLWHAAALKATIFWFVGTGTVLVGSAVTRGEYNDGELLRHALRRVVAVTIVVEFLVNLHALPLAFELVGVSVVMLFFGMQAVVRHDPSYPSSVRKLIDAVLTSVGLIYVVYFVAGVAGDLSGFLTRKTAEDFLVAPALTLAIVPFLYAVAWVSRREEQALRRKLQARLASPV